MWKPHYLANTYKLVKQLTLITSKKWTPKITINPAKQSRGPRCLHMIDAAKAIISGQNPFFYLHSLILKCAYLVFIIYFFKFSSVHKWFLSPLKTFFFLLLVAICKVQNIPVFHNHSLNHARIRLLPLLVAFSPHKGRAAQQVGPRSFFVPRFVSSFVCLTMWGNLC